MRHSASKPSLQCFFALVESWLIRSIVASAVEFISATTKPIGAFDRGPLARIRSSMSAMAAIVLCTAARVSGVSSSDTPSWCQYPPLFRIGHSPFRPVPPDLKALLAKFCSRAQILHRSRPHLCFQLEVELIEEVRFGFEVGE